MAAKEGHINGSLAAKLLGISPAEFRKLVSNGDIPKEGPDNFLLVGVVQGFVAHLRREFTRQQVAPTQVEIAEHLDLSERRVRDVLRELGIDHRDSSLDEVRVKYIRVMREKAAGRGSDNNGQLVESRIEESREKTLALRLDRLERQGEIIVAAQAAESIVGFAAGLEPVFDSVAADIIEHIESKHQITLDDDLVSKPIRVAIGNLASRARKLGEDMAASSGGAGAAGA